MSIRARIRAWFRARYPMMFEWEKRLALSTLSCHHCGYHIEKFCETSTLMEHFKVACPRCHGAAKLHEDFIIQIKMWVS